MLAVPGWPESDRLPNAVALVRPLNSIAQARIVDWTVSTQTVEIES
jgi:hypothetical protein